MVLRLVIALIIVYLVIFLIKKIIVIYQISSVDKLEEKYDKNRRIRNSLQNLFKKVKND